jgi:hypothetical protein
MKSTALHFISTQTNRLVETSFKQRLLVSTYKDSVFFRQIPPSGNSQAIFRPPEYVQLRSTPFMRQISRQL